MKKDSFTFPKAFIKPILKLSDEQLGRLMKAVCQYQLGETPVLADDIAVHFSYFEAYFEEEAEKRRKRAEAAAERRRKKLEEAKAAAGNVQKAEEQPAVVNDWAHFDKKLLRLPDDERYMRQISEIYDKYLERLAKEKPTIYQAGGKDLTLEQFYTLIKLVGMEKVNGFTSTLRMDKTWTQNGHTYFQAMMKYRSLESR